MNTQIWVAILALIGTCIGSFSGILAANKLTNYRIQQLEKKVEKHNNVIERLYKLEQKFNTHESTSEIRLSNLEGHDHQSN